MKVGTQYESSGVYNANANANIAHKRSILNFGGSRNFLDGYRTTDDPFHIEKSSVADESRFQDAKPKEAVNLFWQGKTFLLDEKMKVNARQNWYNDVVYNLGQPSAPYGIEALDQEFKTSRLDQNLTLQNTSNSNKKYSALFAYNYFKRTANTWFNDLTNLNRTLTNNSLQQDTTVFHSAMSRFNWSFGTDSSDLFITLGYDGYYHQMKGQRLQKGVQDNLNVALFTIVETKLTQKLILD